MFLCCAKEFKNECRMITHLISECNEPMHIETVDAMLKAFLKENKNVMYIRHEDCLDFIVWYSIEQLIEDKRFEEIKILFKYKDYFFNPITIYDGLKIPRTVFLKLENAMNIIKQKSS